jgi:hypothetical protein
MKATFVQRTLPALADFLPWSQSQGGAPISVTGVSASARNGGSGNLPGLRQTDITDLWPECIRLASFRICVITYTRACAGPRQFSSSYCLLHMGIHLQCPEHPALDRAQ